MEIDVQKLAETLPHQRWYGGKGRRIAALELIDSATLDDDPPALALAIVRVEEDGGRSQLYHLPLLVDEDGSLRDAFEDVERLRVLGEFMAHGTSIRGEHGTFRFGGAGLDPLDPPGKVTVREMGAEQTNTSLVLDETAIIKVLRRVDIGTNPDLELTRVLTAEGFEHIPPHLGELIYERAEDEDGLRIDLCVAQRFMTDSVEGWQEALKKINQLYDAIDEQDVREDLRFLTEERSGEILTSIEELGEVTASLHVALAREELDAELATEAIDESDLNEWADRALDSLDELLEGDASELTPLEGRIRDRIERLRSIQDPGSKTRAHADYHLGQVLMTGRGWMILDFEGEPARSLEERRAKQSPLRDVAGMLRSFNYAATAALFERADPASDEWRRLEPWSETWETLARERYLHGYLSRSHEGRFLPGDRDDLMTMLHVFEIDKALYELGYERGHRPDWVRIPLHGISRILSEEGAS